MGFGSRTQGNLGALGQGDTYPTWDGTAPAVSMQDGGGGVTLMHREPFNASGSDFDARGSAHLEGSFTGCLNNLALDMMTHVTRGRNISSVLVVAAAFIERDDGASSFVLRITGHTRVHGDQRSGRLGRLRWGRLGLVG